MAVELNIQNPFVADMLNHWIRLRHHRMEYCKFATEAVVKIGKEVIKMQSEMAS